MKHSFFEKGTNNLLALLLAFLLVLTSFVGTLGPRCLPASENNLGAIPEEDTAAPALDEPGPRMTAPLVYDSESNRVILFGGSIDNLESDLSDDWHEMAPAISPGTRCGSPLVYDIESDRMVLFSGWPDLHYDGARYNDTWSYDFNSNTWTNMLPSGLPPGRGGHAMAYDEEADIMVMFGGVTGWQAEYDKYMADTWTYSLNANTWTNMSPAGNPTPRMFAGMTYDNESDVIVMFGGHMQDHSASHETWIYNLTSNSWTNATTASHPEARFLGGMAYDCQNNRVLLGGGGNWDGFMEDIWEYNYTINTWTELTPSTPPPQFGFSITYDSESKVVVAYGGPLNLDEDDLVSQTWAFNLTTGEWNNTYSPNNPLPRSRPFLSYDIESDRTIMYGGPLPDGSQGEALGDTWAYDYRINPPNLPGPPVNLTVNSSEDGLVLTWEPPVAKAGVTVVGYNVYRGSETGVYTLLAECGDVLIHIDRTAGFGIAYYYAATAVSTDGEGPFSNEDLGILPREPYDDGIYTFIAYGDTRGNDETGVSPMHDELVSKYLQLHDPEMIIHSGDMVNHGGEAYQWPLFNESISAIWDWDPNIEFYGAVGNHEIYTDIYGVNDEDYSNYLAFFNFSDVVDELKETELYYSFDRHGIHFIILNTAEVWTDSVFTFPTAQMEWLQADLAKDHNLTVVMTHYPAYSILKDRPDRLAQADSIRDTFHALFIAGGVKVVFAGHNHYYYRTLRDGIQYVTAAGGGAPLYDIQTEGTHWQEGDVGFSEYHYCVASINGNQLEVSVLLMNGTIADSFTLEIYPVITTTTTDGTLIQILMTVGVIGGVALAVIVMVVYIRKKE